MIGQQISHYKVVDSLGQGGMGVVYRAEDVRLGRTVALKFISDQLAGDAAAKKRFDREARAVAALNHPNICTIYDIGEHEGRPYIAMELLVGKTLKQLMGAKKLPTVELLAVCTQMADALSAAHGGRIVHRDIKPANIFIVEGGLVKILDFGLARHSALTSEDNTTHTGVTVQGAPVGTVAYMSPEQALGRAFDHRTDLFSLGVVMYEMAEGRRPFRADTVVATIDRLLHFDPPPLTHVASQHPASLSRIVQKLLQKEPNKRYQAAKVLLTDLKEVHREVESGTPAPAAGARAVGPAPPKPGGGKTTSGEAIKFKAAIPLSPTGGAPGESLAQVPQAGRSQSLSRSTVLSKDRSTSRPSRPAPVIRHDTPVEQTITGPSDQAGDVFT